jgi:biotin carboxyl carrier protein
MKSEMRVLAPAAGVVREIACAPGRLVQDGQRLAVLERDA